MRNIFLLLLTCLVTVSLLGCKEEQVDKETKKVNKETKVEQQVESKEEQQSEEKTATNQSEVNQGMNLLDYRPEVGSKKIFTENGELAFTEEIIAANDEYIQTLLQLGDNLTTQVYRWTKDEISLMYEEYNSENPHESMLDGFVPIEQFETLMNNDSSKAAIWKLLSNDTKEAVPAGDFQNVLIIQKTTNEVVDEETIYTRYYAPKYGLIKEEFNQSGENGYSVKSELEKVE